MAAYLSAYATHHELPVRTRAEVVSLSGRRGEFRIRLSDGDEVTANQVVVATGAFGSPVTPAIAQNLDASVVQLHSESYRNADQVPDGTVLVVGGGNSGCQIALELASAGREVILSESGRSRAVPQRALGRDLFWWLTVSRVIHARPESFVGKRLRASEPVIGVTRRDLRRAGVVFRGRAIAAIGRNVSFASGESVDIGTALWATGYRHDDRWVDVPGAVDADGMLISHGGTTPVDGLFTIGRPWQRSRGSALLGYVGGDAQLLSQVIRFDG